jgi:acetyl esterase/lipase
MTKSRILNVLAGAAILPGSLLALGTFVNNIPFVGTAAMTVFPLAAGSFLLIALGGVAVSLAVVRRGARRIGGVFAIVGLATAIAAVAVSARHASVAKANGVSLNLFATVVPRLINIAGAPDETLSYTQTGGQDLKLDIYRPKGSPGVLAPVLIHIHGGGWIAGDRRARAANLAWFADRGFLGVSLDYALATPENATWQTAAAQVGCGLSWVAVHATEFGGDPGRLFVFGESAGGALALTTSYAAATGSATSSCGGKVPTVRAVAAQVPALDPITFYKNPDSLQGPRAREMVRQYLGGTPQEHPDRARAVSSVSYVTAEAPPTLLFLSDNDHLVPIEGSLQFIDRVRQTSVPLRIVRFPFADHGVANLYYSIANQTWLQTMRQHFCRYGGAC